MDARRKYEMWRDHPEIHDGIRAELRGLDGREDEIQDRFGSELAFGTAGLRGLLGAGTRRMNRYTVAAAAWAMSQALREEDPASAGRGIVISFDSRHQSREFARVSADVLSAQGFTVYLMREMRPVPVLSFAVRYYGAAGGIMITASHNPSQYNGFKAYGPDGCQLSPEPAERIAARMRAVTDPIALAGGAASGRTGTVHDVGRPLDDAYLSMLRELKIFPDAVDRHRDLRVVYTPLHGSGRTPVQRILTELGLTHVSTVAAQEEPDPDFSTVPVPNPEEREALQMAIRQASEESADLVLATDPDADRLGVAVRGPDGTFRVLTGNQIGLLLMDGVLSWRKAAGQLPEDSFCVTTIVSTRLARHVAAAFGTELLECLTGFKYIGEKILELDERGDCHFQFGFEESYGYLAGTEVRDKDAVMAAMLTVCLAADSADRDETLYDRLQTLYRTYGYAAETTLSVTVPGTGFADTIHTLMSELRDTDGQPVDGITARRRHDYLNSVTTDLNTGVRAPLDLPRSDVLLYDLDGEDWFCVRPSGTEPKIKVYVGAYGTDPEECAVRRDQITDALRRWMDDRVST